MNLACPRRISESACHGSVRQTAIVHVGPPTPTFSNILDLAVSANLSIGMERTNSIIPCCAHYFRIGRRYPMNINEFERD
jgi:hypothetical protein